MHKGKDAKNFIHTTGAIRRVQLLLFKAGIIITTWWREEGDWKYIHCKVYKIYISLLVVNRYCLKSRMKTKKIMNIKANTRKKKNKLPKCSGRYIFTTNKDPTAKDKRGGRI